MKKFLILLSLIFTSLTLFACSSGENKEEIQKTSLINVEDYSLISMKQLKKKMGKPQEIEEWIYNDTIPLTTVSYKDHRFEFIFYDDQLIRVTLNSEKYNNSKGKSFSYTSDAEGLHLLGLTTDDVDFAKKKNTGVARRYTEVNEKIYDVWFCDIHDEKVDTIKVTFASGIF